MITAPLPLFVRGARMKADEIQTTKTSDMIDSILKGRNNGRYPLSGCDEPIALIKKDDTTWTYTDNNADIARSTEAVFSQTPEGLISELEIYLGFNDPRLRFVRDHSWHGSYTFVTILERPLFVFEDVSDIEILIQLLDEYGDIQISYGECGQQSIEIRKALAARGYYISTYDSVAKKDKKQARTFLSRLKNKKKQENNTFWVRDMYPFITGMQRFLPCFRSFKSSQGHRTSAHEVFVDFVSLIFMIEGVYGPNSRYRLEPFRQLIGHWRLMSKKSKAFAEESVADFVAWLDREAALPENTEPLITEMLHVTGAVGQLAKPNI